MLNLQSRLNYLMSKILLLQTCNTGCELFNEQNPTSAYKYVYTQPHEVIERHVDVAIYVGIGKNHLLRSMNYIASTSQPDP